MSYKVVYICDRYPQQTLVDGCNHLGVCHPLNLADAFAISAQLQADEWLDTGSRLYELTGNFAVLPKFSDVRR